MVSPRHNLNDFYRRFWNPVLLCCSRMERRGVRLDVDRITAALELARREQDVARQGTLSWIAAVGLDAGEFNPNSNVQVAGLLYDTLGWELPPVEGSLSAIKRRKEDKRPVGEAALAWLAANCAGEEHGAGLKALQRYNKVTRQVEFLERLPACLSPDGRLRSSFAPEAETGRLASKKPNLQNIPSTKDEFGIRACFVPRPGNLLGVFDFKALEIYILAHFLVELYGDWSLYQALATGDVYGAQAVRTWPDVLAGVDPATLKDHPNPDIRRWRGPAKALVLGTNYGKTPQGIALQLGVPDSVGKAYYDAYFRANPSIERFQNDSLREVERHGMVRTLLGRHRYIDLPGNATRGQQGRAKRQGTNTRVQGSAADWVYACMLAVDPETSSTGKELAGLGCELDLQVHDELVFEYPEKNADRCEEVIEYAMVNPLKKFKLAFDLVVDGKSVARWSDAKG